MPRLPPALVGRDVTVVELDPDYVERGRERAGSILAELPDADFDPAVMPRGQTLGPVRAGRVVVVRLDGAASLER